MLERILRDRYGLAVRTLEPLTGGSSGDAVLKVETASGPLVVRPAPRHATARGLRWQHGLLRLLAADLDEVHAPLQTTSGATFVELAGRHYYVLPFIRGEAVTAREVVEHAGALLGRIHAAGASYVSADEPDLPPRWQLDWDSNAFWEWRRVEAALRTWVSDGNETRRRLAAARDRIEAAREWAIGRLRTLVRDAFPAGPIHGDYYRGNVLGDARSITGVIDWSEARIDWLPFELARSTWEFAKDGDDLDVHAARRFVAGYRRTCDRYVDAPLVDLMRTVRVEECLRAIDAAVVLGETHPEADLEYGAHNLRAFDALAGVAL